MFDYLSLHDGPVVAGLEQHETVFAKNQPQYIPMRTLPGENGNSAIARFHPTNEQRNAIAEGADLYLEILHFKGPLAPSRLMVMSDPSAKQTRFKSWWRSQTKGPYEVNDDAAKAELETDSQESPAAERSEAAAPRSVVAGTKYSEILVAAQPAPTPRTDALHNQMEDSAYPDMLDLARQLERDLAAAGREMARKDAVVEKAMSDCAKALGEDCILWTLHEKITELRAEQEGMVLVPKEPTTMQIQSGAFAIPTTDRIRAMESARQCYRAMLAAAKEGA